MADPVQVVEHTARTLTDHLPVLQVLIPFMAAPIIVFLGSKRLAWGLAFLATAASFVVSILLMLSVQEGNFVAYTMGGWAPPLGIEYRIDAANAFVLLLISSIGTVVLPFAYPSVKEQAMRSMSSSSWKSHRYRPMFWLPKVPRVIVAL